MVFSLRKHIITNTDLCINNQIIDRVEHTMFLGVILDAHLTWSYHIQHVETICTHLHLSFFFIISDFDKCTVRN